MVCSTSANLTCLLTSPVLIWCKFHLSVSACSLVLKPVEVAFKHTGRWIWRNLDFTLLEFLNLTFPKLNTWTNCKYLPCCVIMQSFTEIVFWTFLQLIQLSLLSKPQQNPCKNESIPAVNRFIYLCFKSQYSEPRCPDQIGFNDVWTFNLDSQLTGQCKAISFFFPA